MRRRIVAVLFTGAMLGGVMASPAAAHEGADQEGCPPGQSGWLLAERDPSGDPRSPDRNGDDHYCYKHLPEQSNGRGNIFQEHLKENHKDNNSP